MAARDVDGQNPILLTVAGFLFCLAHCDNNRTVSRNTVLREVLALGFPNTFVSVLRDLALELFYALDQICRQLEDRRGCDRNGVSSETGAPCLLPCVLA